MKYDEIGLTYNSTRSADERITNRIIDLLNQPIGSKILDIGAGTGNYTFELANSGFNMIAVEPSKTMREQGKKHERIIWRKGFAEKLPIKNNSVDGVICTLATHHFSDLEQSFQEMKRVLKETGKLIIFTADPRVCYNDCWIVDYFKEFVDESLRSQPSFEDMIRLLENNTNRNIKIDPFLIPFDLKDKFFFSGWRKPEAYLDSVYRSGISSLAKVPEVKLEPYIDRLKEDLNNGEWHEKYKNILSMEEYDCGYIFFVG